MSNYEYIVKESTAEGYGSQVSVLRDKGELIVHTAKY